MGAAVSGGSQPTTMDLLAQNWDTLPTTAKNIAAGSSGVWTMAGATPVLTAQSVITGYFNNYSVHMTVYVQVSEDGTNWTSVITVPASASYGTVKSASLSAYAGKRLFVRCRATNPTASGITASIKPVYSKSGTPIFQIL